MITWQLVTNFPGGDFNLTARIAAGLVASLLLFGSLIAHEVMHSLVAQASGIPVHSITLFIFGGVSQITREPQKPGDEVRIALAGPLTSLVCGGIFFGIWFMTKNTPAMIREIILWLGQTNIILAIFNLIPVPPLDGSRILTGLLPLNLAYEYVKIEKFGFLITVVLVWFGIVWRLVVPGINFFCNLWQVPLLG